jgi:hypothetical protein
MRDLRGRCWADLSDIEKGSLHIDVQQIMRANPEDVVLVGKLASRNREGQH